MKLNSQSGASGSLGIRVIKNGVEIRKESVFVRILKRIVRGDKHDSGK